MYNLLVVNLFDFPIKGTFTSRGHDCEASLRTLPDCSMHFNLVSKLITASQSILFIFINLCAVEPEQPKLAEIPQRSTTVNEHDLMCVIDR